MVPEPREEERLSPEDDVFDIRETYRAQEMALGDAGWNDPRLDPYNNYDSHRQATDGEQKPE